MNMNMDSGWSHRKRKLFKQAFSQVDKCNIPSWVENCNCDELYEALKRQNQNRDPRGECSNCPRKWSLLIINMHHVKSSHPMINENPDQLIGPMLCCSNFFVSRACTFCIGNFINCSQPISAYSSRHNTLVWSTSFSINLPERSPRINESSCLELRLATCDILQQQANISNIVGQWTLYESFHGDSSNFLLFQKCNSYST
jgi:hypothetical protein